MFYHCTCCSIVCLKLSLVLFLCGHVMVLMFVLLLCFCVVKCYSDNVLFLMLSCVLRSVFAMDMFMSYMLL